MPGVAGEVAATGGDGPSHGRLERMVLVAGAGLAALPAWLPLVLVASSSSSSRIVCCKLAHDVVQWVIIAPRGSFGRVSRGDGPVSLVGTGFTAPLLWASVAIGDHACWLLPSLHRGVSSGKVLLRSIRTPDGDRAAVSVDVHVLLRGAPTGVNPGELCS